MGKTFSARGRIVFEKGRGSTYFGKYGHELRAKRLGMPDWNGVRAKRAAMNKAIAHLLVLLALGTNGWADSPAEEVPEAAVAERPSLGKRLLWYAPNRVMDLMDVFRLRLRVGPGLAANFRLTDYGAFYVGRYDAIYAGLPGPRGAHRLRSPAGVESLHGVVIAGVDATDDTRKGPEYGVAEVDVGVQLLLVGAEAGVDAAEIGDFIGGLLLFDPEGDDFPRKRTEIPEKTSAIALGAGEGVFAVDPKPERFASMGARMDYLHANVQRRISEPLRATDAYFADDSDAPIVPPQAQVRLGLYGSAWEGKDFEFELKPNVEMDVELPNLKRRLRVFVETERANDLPERDTANNEDKGLNVGARKWFEKLNLSADVGVKAQWPPEAFARLIWTREWEFGKWGMRPEQRIFYETDDGFGALGTLRNSRWLGAGSEGLFQQNLSAKWSTETETLTWSASASFARVPALLDENLRGKNAGWEDSARAQAIRYTCFGSDGSVDSHRVVLGFRGPLYKRWIYWEADPGLEWHREDDYETTFMFRCGIDMLFWGRAYE